VNPDEAAARKAFDLHGALSVLRAAPGGSVTYRAVGVGIVRVDRTASALVARARLLSARGAPVVEPLAGPVLINDRIVSLWRDAANDPEPDFAAMGRALRGLHDIGGRLVDDGELAVDAFDPAAWLEQRLAGARDADLCSKLRRRVSAAAAALTGAATLLHTDAHAANFRVHHHQALLVDLEGLSTGPALYDLAAMEVTQRRFRRDRASFVAFAHGYGADPDQPGLAAMIELREALAVGFVAGLGRLDAAWQRWATLADRDAVWTPF
jgi:Phosphotransferase enzyme family